MVLLIPRLQPAMMTMIKMRTGCDVLVIWICTLRHNLWVAMVSVVTNSFTLYVLLQIQSLLNFPRISILSDYTKTVLHFPVIFYLMTSHLPSGQNIPTLLPMS